MFSTLQTQKTFFEKLKAVIPNEQLANNVADVLDISVGEAYKKISGKSLINFEQLLLLCNKFNVSFNYNPLNGDNKALFSYSSFLSGEYTIERYLDNFYKTLLYIKSQKNSSVICTTDEIPIFHLFKYPELAAFKIYYWKSRQNKNKPGIKMESFSVDAIDKELIEKCYLIYKEFNCVASTEIWAKTAIQYTLQQIEYAVDAFYIRDKKLLTKMYEALENVIYDVAEYSINGIKNNESDHPIHFNWAVCENIASTTYLYKADDNMGCYQRFNTFNTLQTDDKAYCNEVNLWINNIYRESTCFSGQSEKHRNIYVTSTINAIHAVKDQFLIAQH